MQLAMGCSKQMVEQRDYIKLNFVFIKMYKNKQFLIKINHTSIDLVIDLEEYTTFVLILMHEVAAVAKEFELLK